MSAHLIPPAVTYYDSVLPDAEATVTRTSTHVRRSRWIAGGISLAAAGWASYVAMTWLRYGHPAQPRPFERDALLDRFMPVCDVVERHHVHVRAPAAVTLSAARDLDLSSLPLVRAIFRGRELLLGATPDGSSRTAVSPRRSPVRRGLVDEMLALGWGVLAEIPDRAIAVGAVTKPWEPNVTFRSVPADAFATFNEPGYVRIVWTLRADPTGPDRSVFLTETRAVATDATSRSRFRRYWSLLSPGIWLIRRLSLRPIKHRAEIAWGQV